MNERIQPPLSRRLGHFALSLSLALLFIYGFLPAMTGAVPVLARMAGYLDQNGIDPTRYYYTDVEQVQEGEHHIATALGRR